MGAFERGDVVVVRFPFTNLSGSTVRPAVVVQNLSGPDMILCMITSRPARDADAIPLDDAAFMHGSLTKPSNIRPNRLFTGEDGIVSSRIGKLKADMINNITDAIVTILRR